MKNKAGSFAFIESLSRRHLMDVYAFETQIGPSEQALKGPQMALLAASRLPFFEPFSKALFLRGGHF